MLTPEQENKLLELTIEKVKKIQKIVPQDHDLSSALSSHLTSLYYTPPESAYFRMQLLAQCLSSQLGEPQKDWESWKQEVYDIWVVWPTVEELDEVDEPTELESDTDLSDCGITLLSQKDDKINLDN